MKCLNCETEIVHKPFQVDGINVSCDICDVCNSLFIGGDALKKLSFDASVNLEKATGMPVVGKTEACPACDASMEKLCFIGGKDIVIDGCVKCGGLWMDGGDIEEFAGAKKSRFPSEWGAFSGFLNDMHVLNWERGKKAKEMACSSGDCVPIEGSELAGETDYECPSCKSRLSKYKTYGIEIEGCSCCGGIWLDTKELKTLKDRATSGLWTTLRWMDDEVESVEKAGAILSGRICPRCDHVKLVSTSLKGTGVIVDYCLTCHGVWLDGNEFHAIIQLHRKQLLGELSTDDMKKKVYEEIKEIWSGHESVMSEILDAKAAISALISISIYNHPRLAKAMLGLNRILIP